MDYDLFLSMLNNFLIPCILTVISDSQSEGFLQMNRGEFSNESWIYGSVWITSSNHMQTAADLEEEWIAFAGFEEGGVNLSSGLQTFFKRNKINLKCALLQYILDIWILW